MNDPGAFVTVRIEDSEISRNGFPGIVLRDVFSPTIDNNGIFGNMVGQSGQRFNLRVEAPFGSITVTNVDARNNYWGAPYPNPADSMTKKLGIFDERDPGNVASVPVLIDPWLNANP